MPIGVAGGRRAFHWESASKPALNRCLHRVPQGPHVPSLPPHLSLYPCPHHHHRYLYHRPRRRPHSGDPPRWHRRESDAAPPSLAASWQTEPSRLLTPDSASVSWGRSSSSSPDRSRCESQPVLSAKSSYLATRMASAASAARSTSGAGGGDDGCETSTAAAKEVKQYLNRTLFPRPSSTLHGYASLYHRLKKLPTSHRKARQRGKTAPEMTVAPAATASAPADEKFPEAGDGAEGQGIVSDRMESIAKCPPRVEIHIYVPTAATATAASLQQEGGGHRYL